MIEKQEARRCAAASLLLTEYVSCGGMRVVGWRVTLNSS